MTEQGNVVWENQEDEQPWNRQETAIGVHGHRSGGTEVIAEP